MELDRTEAIWKMRRFLRRQVARFEEIRIQAEADRFEREIQAHRRPDFEPRPLPLRWARAGA